MMRHPLLPIFCLFLLGYPVAAQQFRPAVLKSPVVRQADPVRQYQDSLHHLFDVKQPGLKKTQTAYPARTHAISGNPAGRTQSLDCDYFCRSVIVLPVTGLELEAVRLNDYTVKLNWKTYAEFDNRGFDIERSVENTAHFSRQSFVAGSGTTVATTHYQAFDPNSFEAVSFYRLKQIDRDSHYVYSNVVAVNGVLRNPGLQIYPNPGTADQVQFRISGLKPGTLFSVRIADALGRMNGTLPSRIYTGSTGYTLREFGIFSPGVYWLTVQSDQTVLTERFVITR